MTRAGARARRHAESRSVLSIDDMAVLIGRTANAASKEVELDHSLVRDFDEVGDRVCRGARLSNGKGWKADSNEDGELHCEVLLVVW